MLVYKVVWKFRTDGYGLSKRPCRFEGWYLLGLFPLWVVQKQYVD